LITPALQSSEVHILIWATIMNCK